MTYPMTPRQFAGAAALAVLIGVGIAHCQNRADERTADPCTAVIDAMAVARTPPPARKPGSEPGPARSYKPSSQPRLHLDLDGDGC